MSRNKQAPPLAYPGKRQRDLVAESPIACPTCGGPWRAAKRVCRKCGQVVSRRHRWHLIPAGPGLWAIEHHNCEEPTTTTPSTAKENNVTPEAPPPAAEHKHQYLGVDGPCIHCQEPMPTEMAVQLRKQAETPFATRVYAAPTGDRA